MSKTLREDIQDYIDFLKNDVEDLENRRTLTSKARREALKEVLGSLEDLLESDRTNMNKEKYKEIINKAKKKSYIENRLQEVADGCNINKAIEEYHNLGLANAYGYIMYMLDQDFDKKDMRKVIIDGIKGDVQFRSDVYGVWGELMDKSK